MESDANTGHLGLDRVSDMAKEWFNLPGKAKVIMKYIELCSYLEL